MWNPWLSDHQGAGSLSVKSTWCGILHCQIYRMGNSLLSSLQDVGSQAVKSTGCGILGCQIIRVQDPWLSNLQGVVSSAVKSTGCRICAIKSSLCGSLAVKSTGLGSLHCQMYGMRNSVLLNLQGVESGRIKSKGCRNLAFPIYTVRKPKLSEFIVNFKEPNGGYSFKPCQIYRVSMSYKSF